jgi:toxin ParE1/3/4
MPSVLCTSRANLDLVEIALNIAKENPSAADRWLDRFDAKCKTLAQMPELGRERPDLAPGLKGLPFGNYIIFYRLIPEGIQVVRILHGARDITALLG